MIWLRIMALIAACLLTSCIDGHEEFWLNANGSGRAEISYSLPAKVAKLKGGETGIRALIENFLARTPAIKSGTCEVTTVDGRLNIKVGASFDSALDLKEISTSRSLDQLPSSATSLAGKFDVKVRGRTLEFGRTISAGSALAGSMFMPASSFQGHRLVYIVHLPTPAVESNATQTTDDGRTLVWDVALADAVKAPVTTRFKAQIPIPIWAIGLIGAATLLFALLSFHVFRRSRRS